MCQTIYDSFTVVGIGLLDLYHNVRISGEFAFHENIMSSVTGFAVDGDLISSITAENDGGKDGMISGFVSQ